MTATSSTTPDVLERRQVRGTDVLGGPARIQWPDDAIDWLPRRSPPVHAGLAQEGETRVYTQSIRSVYAHLMSVPLTLLGLLEREPSHGYDLKREYDAYFGRSRPLPFGQVYATLGRLARDGKVVISDVAPGEGPDRKRYVITERGATEVETWLTEPVEPEPHQQTVLFAKVVLALMLDRPAAQYLDTQRAAHLQRMRELTEIKRTGSLVDALLADHALFHLEADLRWIDLTTARLDALAGAVRS
jgi:DNA-binding PadR family transcriptional regulator